MSPSLRRLADAVGQTEETATLLKNAARCPNRVTGGKTRSEYIFSELPQVADIRQERFFDDLANPFVSQITAFWVQAIPGEL
jgi:hypothetical protein